MKRVYIICPVRNLSKKERQKILTYTKNLEKTGYKVRLPFRDTNQDDEIGLRICEEHEKDILLANEIHIFWHPKSEGSLWDFAQVRMAMSLGKRKKIVLVNKENIKITPQKSFTNVLLATSYGLPPTATLQDLVKKHKST
jgi:hypothetical protein